MGIRKTAKLVREFLDSDNWKYRYINNKEYISFVGDVHSSHCLSCLRVFITVTDKEVMCYYELPVSAKECLPQMAEFVMRANYGLNTGSFMFDYDDGQLRFKVVTSSQAMEGNPTEEMHRLLYVPLGTIRTYARGIIGVLSGYETAEEALRKCEEKD